MCANTQHLLIIAATVCLANSLLLGNAKRLQVSKLSLNNAVPKLRTLLIDNFDSYTYNLWQLLSDVNGAEPHVVYNNAYGGKWESLLNIVPPFDNIVISPGPGSPDNHVDFGLCTDAILRSDAPLLGVCLGHQGMVHAYGGRVVRALQPMHGRLSKVQHEDTGIFAGIDQNIEVVRYHSLVADSPLPSVLRPTAWTMDGTIMGLEHKTRPQYGVQFHPESIKTSCGRSLVANFRDITLQHLARNKQATSGSTTYKSKIFPFVDKVPPSRPPSHIPKRYVRITTLPMPTRSNVTTAEVFSQLYGAHPASIWLDSESPGPVQLGSVIGEPTRGDPAQHQQSANGHHRMTYMGALDTPGAYAVEYHGNRRLIKRTMLPKSTREDTVHPQSQPVKVDVMNMNIFEFLREKLEQESAVEQEITQSYRNCSMEEAESQLAPAECDISMTSALFGYLGYESGQEAVNILAAQTSHDNAHYNLIAGADTHNDELVRTPQPMAVLMHPTQYVVYDHSRRLYHVVDLQANHTTESGAGATLADRLEHILRCENTAVPAAAPSNTPSSTATAADEPSPQPVLTGRKCRADYKADIAACLDSITAGETYEVCLTTQFSGPPAAVTPTSSDLTAHSLTTYKRLRQLNAAPYACYLRYDPLALSTCPGCDGDQTGSGAVEDQALQWHTPGGFAICSTSPECFLKVDQTGRMSSKPIKGTAKRDLTDPAADLRIAAALASDEKSQAENLMIVDLVRNDLGRVCEVGSVTVPKLMDIESYATVHQMVSTVQGQLRQGCDIVDALIATFPGGSMTGAPKLRTMSIIRSLEHRPRGVYSGSMGFIGLNGAADLNIVIRTAVLTANSVTIGAGGAIVALSDPDEEVEEVSLKATAVAKALGYGLDFGDK